MQIKYGKQSRKTYVNGDAVALEHEVGRARVVKYSWQSQEVQFKWSDEDNKGLAAWSHKGLKLTVYEEADDEDEVYRLSCQSRP